MKYSCSAQDVVPSTAEKRDSLYQELILLQCDIITYLSLLSRPDYTAFPKRASVLNVLCVKRQLVTDIWPSFVTAFKGKLTMKVNGSRAKSKIINNGRWRRSI